MAHASQKHRLSKCDAELLNKCITIIQMVTTQHTSTQSIKDMFTSSDIETQSTTVAASLTPKENLFRASCRNSNPSLFNRGNCCGTSGWRQWATQCATRSKLTSFAKQTRHTEFLFWSEPASSDKSGRPFYAAQLDLKNALGHMEHSFATTPLRDNGCPVTATFGANASHVIPPVTISNVKLIYFRKRWNMT